MKIPPFILHHSYFILHTCSRWFDGGENGKIHGKGMNAVRQSCEQSSTMGSGHRKIRLAPDVRRVLICEQIHNEGCVNPVVQNGTLSTVMKLMQMQSRMQIFEFMTKEDAYSSIGCSPRASCRHA